MLRFTVLAENTPGEDGLSGEHGLSLHIRTERYSILFDMGTGGLFATNAAKLGVNLEEVDLAIVSHGHYDHGGGLQAFLSLNAQAPVFVHADAFRGHFARRKGGHDEDIGLDPRLRDHPRLVLTGDRHVPGEDLLLFSDVRGRRLIPAGNRTLFRQAGSKTLPDDFSHEQNLIISEGETSVLVTGCSHRGIINILERFKELMGKAPDCVVGGLHLSNPALGTGEDATVVDTVAEVLKADDILCYTGHCTGDASAARLQSILGDRLKLLRTGLRFECEEAGGADGL